MMLAADVYVTWSDQVSGRRIENFALARGTGQTLLQVKCAFC